MRTTGFVRGRRLHARTLARRYHVCMDASPLLVRVLAALRDRKLEAVLIGNAAAALHGAPVTTLDFDFLFRETTTNLAKLKQVAKDCDAMILRPFYPVSKLYRVVNDDLGLQADFMPMIHGIRSFEGVRARATQRVISGFSLLVASLDDIYCKQEGSWTRPRSRRFACPRADTTNCHRPAHSFETKEAGLAMKRRKTPVVKKPAATRAEALAVLSQESDEQLDELIRRRLALPLEKRMNFLRKRLPGGGSCL
ncbi:MAG: hypothetical protein ACKOOF_12330 [Planctomycetaceae bacterium]